MDLKLKKMLRNKKGNGSIGRRPGIFLFKGDIRTLGELTGVINLS